MSPTADTTAILAAIERNRDASIEDFAAVRAELASLRRDVGEIANKGCAQAWQHKTHEERLHKVEESVAEYRGKLAVIAGSASLVGGAMCAWVTKKL